jgi:hypothetical protein
MGVDLPVDTAVLKFQSSVVRIKSLDDLKGIGIGDWWLKEHTDIVSWYIGGWLGNIYWS